MYGLAFAIGIHKKENAFISENYKPVGFEGIFCTEAKNGQNTESKRKNRLSFSKKEQYSFL